MPTMNNFFAPETRAPLTVHQTLLIGILLLSWPRYCEATEVAPTAATLTVRGKVIHDDNHPCSDTDVYVVHRPLYHDDVLSHFTTESDGSFTATEVPVGERVRVFAIHKGFSLGMIQQTFLHPVQTEPLEIRLTPVHESILQVTTATGEPLAEATLGPITWNGPNGVSYVEPRLADRMGIEWPQSDSSGKILLSFLPRSTTVTGEIRHPRFARETFKVTIESNPAAPPSITLKPGIEFKLHVVGKGVETPTNRFQLSMSREGDSSMVFSDEQISLNGSNDFKAIIPPGTYRTLMLRHPDLQTLPGVIHDIEFESDQTEQVEISITPRGITTGRIVRAGSGDPLSGKRIEAFNYSPEHLHDYYGVGKGWYYSARATTDQEGNYTITPGVGPVRLVHRDRRWTSVEPYLEVNIGLINNIRVPNLHLYDGLSLTGFIVDSEGNPVPLAVVQPSGAQSYRQPVLADRQGHFEYQVQDITKEREDDRTGYIELLVLDPYRPLALKTKVPLNPEERTQEIKVVLESESIPDPPKPSTAVNPDEFLLVGRPAPELVFAKAFDAGDTSLKITDLRGKFVLLHFWATWCRPCLSAMPTIEMLHSLYPEQALVVIGIHHNSVSTSAVERFLKEHPSNHPNILDTANGDIYQKYGIRDFPSYVLIGPDGTVIMSSHENRELIGDHLVESLRQFLNASGKLVASRKAQLGE